MLHERSSSLVVEAYEEAITWWRYGIAAGLTIVAFALCCWSTTTPLAQCRDHSHALRWVLVGLAAFVVGIILTGVSIVRVRIARNNLLCYVLKTWGAEYGLGELQINIMRARLEKFV